MEQSKITEKILSLEKSMQYFSHKAHKISRCLEIMSVNIGAAGFQLERARDAITEGNGDAEKYLDTAQDWMTKTSDCVKEILSCLRFKEE